MLYERVTIILNWHTLTTVPRISLRRKLHARDIFFHKQADDLLHRTARS